MVIMLKHTCSLIMSTKKRLLRMLSCHFHIGACENVDVVNVTGERFHLNAIIKCTLGQ